MRTALRPRNHWNHNTHYFPLILRLVAAKPRSNALDVGAGDGELASRLAQLVPSVVGLDSSAGQVAEASAAYAGVPGLRFELGDLLSATLPDEPFDAVTCSATVHHMNLDAALSRLRDLTAPGGVLVVVGLATDESLLDRILHALSILPVRLARAARGWHDHGAPKRDPEDSYATVRETAQRILPGVRFRRRLYWRYSLEWHRPRVARAVSGSGPTASA